MVFKDRADKVIRLVDLDKVDCAGDEDLSALEDRDGDFLALAIVRSIAFSETLVHRAVAPAIVFFEEGVPTVLEFDTRVGSWLKTAAVAVRIRDQELMKILATDVEWYREVAVDQTDTEIRAHEGVVLDNVRESLDHILKDFEDLSVHPFAVLDVFDAGHLDRAVFEDLHARTVALFGLKVAGNCIVKSAFLVKIVLAQFFKV